MNDYIYSEYFPSSIFAGTVLRPGYPLDPYYSICRRLAIITAPSSYPERQFPRDTISSVQSVPLAWNRTQTDSDHIRSAGRISQQ